MTTITKIGVILLDVPRSTKKLVVIAFDCAACILTVALAYRLRLDVWIFPAGNQWFSYALSVLIALPLFIHFGLYRAIFRYVGWDALVAIVRACACFALCYAIIFTLIGVDSVPRSVGLLHPILLFLFVNASRGAARYMLGHVQFHVGGSPERRRVLIYGAGSAGRQLAAGLSNSREMQIVGFLDDDQRLHGSVLKGNTIYSPKRIVELVDELRVTDVLLAIPSTSRARRNEIVEQLRGFRVTVRTLPGLFELADGKVTISDLRPLEIEDLLGRDPVPPDQALFAKCITGRSVMVTGAGGSIGSELCRQVLSQSPSHLILVESSEFNLYTIHGELSAYLTHSALKTEIVPVLASVQDNLRMGDVFAARRVDTVYHAAAYKHVPLVEANPAEALKNNLLGTRNIAQLAHQHCVQHFVLISTDKAVRPTNVMGATKRGAELVLQALAQQPGQTCFAMVRFGNVLGSSGSVVPLFRKQIASGGPVTLTHPDITRYFMTIPEAAQLVIQAGAMADGGEVFVLDMGQPVRIMDLARRMIELTGLKVRDANNPDGDIEIQIVGIRPGEKLFEELLIDEKVSATEHPRILKASEYSYSADVLAEKIHAIMEAVADKDEAAIRACLTDLVPEYQPNQA